MPIKIDHRQIDNTEVEKIKAYPRLNTAPNAGHHENRINQWFAGVNLKVNNKHDKQPEGR